MDVYPLVKMAKELKARFTKGKESGDEYLYASWLQRLIVDSVSFDDGFLAAGEEEGGSSPEATAGVDLVDCRRLRQRRLGFRLREKRTRPADASSKVRGSWKGFSNSGRSKAS